MVNVRFIFYLACALWSPAVGLIVELFAGNGAGTVVGIAWAAAWGIGALNAWGNINPHCLYCGGYGWINNVTVDGWQQVSSQDDCPECDGIATRADDGSDISHKPVYWPDYYWPDYWKPALRGYPGDSEDDHASFCGCPKCERGVTRTGRESFIVSGPLHFGSTGTQHHPACRCPDCLERLV
jgi:hypothetical protein